MKAEIKGLKDPVLRSGEMLLMTLISVPVGAAAGAVVALFGDVLIRIGSFRTEHFELLIPFLVPAGILIVFEYKRFGGKASKGMGQVFAAGQREDDELPLRLAPLIIVSTWITQLFGGSSGREAAAVQIGASISYNIGNKLNLKDSSHIFLVAGMAAGFAGLFETPIAAVFFAIEVLYAGRLDLAALPPSFAAAYTASKTSSLLGLKKFEFIIDKDIDIDGMIFFKLIVLGMIFGLAGALFAFLLKNTKKVFASVFEDPYKRIIIVGIVLAVMLFVLHRGRYSGLGTDLIDDCFSGGTVYAYDWILKLIFTVLTLSSGFQGGEVTPLFCIGSCLGAVIAGLLGLPAELAAALGFVSVFGSATNTLLAPIFLGIELFGSSSAVLFFIVCVAAYVVKGNISIYDQKAYDEN